VLRLIESGLQDISISRSRFPWGIPFPGDPDHTVYVWFDALINYVSGTGFPDPGYDRLWPADLHIVGKGISRFHCVIWPAMLMAAEMPLPKQVWAHGYVQWEGAKMSKTAGTAVSLGSAIERHGPDPLRYFLMREIGFEGDGNFTWDRFDERYTADLADGLGNLASRVLAMVSKYRDGLVPEAAADTALDASGSEVIERYQTTMDDLDLRGGAEAVWALVSAGNLFVAQTAPWALAKAGEEAQLDSTLASLIRCLYRLAVLVSPFMPEKGDALWRALGQEGTAASAKWKLLVNPPVTGAQTTKGAALFPKTNSA
jgi:methionyl-tRNA synthetase